MVRVAPFFDSRCRSIWTVHTSAKAPLTSVAICDPDRHQNFLIICSLAQCQPSLKISCKSVEKFLRKVANSQTDKQKNDYYISSLAEVIIFIVVQVM